MLSATIAMRELARLTSKESRTRPVMIVLLLASLGGCATQRPYQPPNVPTPESWNNAVTMDGGPPVVAKFGSASTVSWWRSMHDPAINTLIEATLLENPTLQQAAERVQEARASLSVAHADQVPQLSANGSVTRGSILYPNPVTHSFTIVDTTKLIGTGLDWELDLWSRLRETARAAKDRLDERNADAAAARLSIAAQVAQLLLNARACRYTVMVRNSDIVSRELELKLMQERLVLGNVAPVDEANAQTNLAAARTVRLSEQQHCLGEIDALVALTGALAHTVEELVMAPLTSHALDRPGDAPSALDIDLNSVIPQVPSFQPALPASILLLHPNVVAAEREAAATWSEIAVARAQRLPQIDLNAVLAGNWIRALGESLRLDTWSLGASFTAPLIDGGGGAAGVRGAQARYREAVAGLRDAVRSTTRNIEDALAEQQSADGRVETSRQELKAAVTTLRANEERWRLGAISQFDLQVVRRQYTAAQQDAIDAVRDRAIAWVDLVTASDSTSEEPSITLGGSLENSQPFIAARGAPQ